jgi:hypothetical protein
MMMWHDLVMRLFPRCKGTKLGPDMMAAVTEFVKGTWAGKTLPDTFQRDVQRWFKIGAKIMILIDRFGGGCLFYVLDVLPNNL